MGDQGRRLGEERGVLCDQRIAGEFGMPGQRPDAQHRSGQRDAAQLRDAGDVDQSRRLREAKRQRREQALATGQDLRLRTRLVEDAPELVERFDAGIAHRRPLHGTSPRRGRRPIPCGGAASDL
jgi:hypothetical protein